MSRGFKIVNIDGTITTVVEEDVNVELSRFLIESRQRADELKVRDKEVNILENQLQMREEEINVLKGQLNVSKKQYKTSRITNYIMATVSMISILLTISKIYLDYFWI